MVELRCQLAAAGVFLGWDIGPPCVPFATSALQTGTPAVLLSELETFIKAAAMILLGHGKFAEHKSCK